MLSLSGADPWADESPDEARSEAPPSGGNGTAAAAIDPRRLVRDLNAFRDARLGRSLWELGSTAVPFVLLAAATMWAVSAGYLLALLLAVPTGLFLLRLFLIQHDCGHGAFFPKRAANDWLGRALGVLTLTPYDCWRRSHALHHASTGNLDARGFGDVDTLTIREYRERSRWGQLTYRIYRHPLVLLGVGPAYQFLVRHRYPNGLSGSQYWVSAMATNAATAVLLAALALAFGIGTVALVLVPTVLTAATVGVWLFYIQHQFEEAHWDQAADWSFHDAALHGSSHLDLPPVMRWFTANIGIHHVHHLASRIPFYRLPEVLRACPELAGVNRMTPSQTFATLRLALWDEDRRRLVPLPPIGAERAL